MERLLILGGSRFIGRHLVEQATGQGRRVTVFNRGTTPPRDESGAAGWPQGVTALTGDRDGGLQEIASRIDAGERWDAVIDFSGYVPRIVRDSASLLRPACGRLLFVSTISVYPLDGPYGMTEESETLTPPPPDVEEVKGDTYGPLKVACELAATEVFADDALIVRPGIVGGPLDHTDRLGYWAARADAGEPFIAPDAQDQPFQVIDARDLAAFMLRLLDDDARGVYNATGERTTLGAAVDACVSAAGPDAGEPVWIDEAWLLEQGVQPNRDLPLWAHDRSQWGFRAIDTARAEAAGLQRRPLRDTARDHARWLRTDPGPFDNATLGRERELELLSRWHNRPHA